MRHGNLLLAETCALIAANLFGVAPAPVETERGRVFEEYAINRDAYDLAIDEYLTKGNRDSLCDFFALRISRWILAERRSGNPPSVGDHSSEDSHS